MTANTGDATPHQPPQYQVAHLRRALAEDPRTAELGIRVTVRGDAIQVAGDVTCPERRDDIETVLRELVPGMRVLNDLRVTEVGAPTGREELR
jgi:hypothetical protein